MVKYRRVRESGRCYFLTINLFNRHIALLTEHIDLVKQSLQKALSHYPCHIQAIVILPEHIHMLLQLPSNQIYYMNFVRLFKSRFSHLYHQNISIQPFKIWQPRYWEHCIRNQQDWLIHLNYIHRNPVKHHWVKSTKEWPYSSFHRYVAHGYLDINWLGDENDDGEFGE